MVPAAVLPPETFTRAVRGLTSVRPRPEIRLEEFGAPRKLAPYAFALGATVRPGDDARDEAEVCTGRLILLHDPAGHPAWSGTLRLVTYVTAEVEPELAADPLLPGVGWSWLVGALEAHGATYTAAGGTITRTASTRFGELAGDQPTAADLEIRASWTPLDNDLAPHLEAWCALLSDTAGLPPPGTASISGTR